MPCVRDARRQSISNPLPFSKAVQSPAGMKGILSLEACPPGATLSTTPDARQAPTEADACTSSPMPPFVTRDNMTATGPNVCGKSTILTESLLKTLVSSAVRRVQLRHDLTDQDLGDLISCSPDTIGHARNMEVKMQAHTLFNLLLVDEMALEGLLHHFGRRSVPIEAKCDTDALVTTSSAVAKLAAVNPGGKMTDHECLEIEPAIDAALESLSGIKSRCHTIRQGRAA